jgi:hypothetical protein
LTGFKGPQTGIERFYLLGIDVPVRFPGARKFGRNDLA